MNTWVEETAVKNKEIAIIGLGYVGLPLAIEFSKHFNVIGFDIDVERIKSLIGGIDKTDEVSSETLSNSQIKFTSAIEDLRSANVYIVTVPTPVNKDNSPDLAPLVKSSEMIGSVLKSKDIVIYESTVYPGATEEACVPVLEANSNMKLNRDFFVGYSPERINPGDKNRGVADIVKVTSGSTKDAADQVDQLYNKVIKAGTFKASSIKVAEASKVIENTQRDLNIALVNELAIIFNCLEIDTLEVLEAAGTKWNFLPFRPGLVGGHCISVDPYYLTHKAQSIGYMPDVILAGRKINDGMGVYVASQLIKKMTRSEFTVKGSKVLVMGVSFKENCPDLRNSKVVDVVQELQDYGLDVDVYDPVVDKTEVFEQYGIKIKAEPSPEYYDAVVVAVGHDAFKEMGSHRVRQFCRTGGIIYDIKYVFDKDSVDMRL